MKIPPRAIHDFDMDGPLQDLDDPGRFANPYYSAYAWWFDDEWGHEHGPYETQMAATRALFQHMAPKQTWRQHFMDWLR